MPALGRQRPVKLGRLAPRRDARTLPLIRYVPAEIPRAPQSVDHFSAAREWPLYRNNEIGDCTCAGAAHLLIAVSAAAGNPLVIPEPAVLDLYRATGWDGTPATDRGAVMLDVLKLWMRRGLGGHRIDGFAAVDPRNISLVEQVIHVFGALYLGIGLPECWEDDAALWAVEDPQLRGASAVGSWGGHATAAVGYDALGVWVVTWGHLVRLTWAAFAQYVEEAWCVLTPAALDRAGRSPLGLDLAALQADLARVTA